MVCSMQVVCNVRLMNEERLILAVWILRRFSVSILRKSTENIGEALEEKRKIPVHQMLDKVYDLKKKEERLSRDEIGTSC